MQAQAQQLERLASDLRAVAFDFAEPARSLSFAERRIAEVERITTIITTISSSTANAFL